MQKMTKRSRRDAKARHTELRTWADGMIEAHMLTGDPNSDETCERFVAAELNFGTNHWDEARITVKHFKNGTSESERQIGGFTLADARALVKCLESVLAKMPVATRFAREAGAPLAARAGAAS